MVDRLLASGFADLNIQNKLGDTAVFSASIKNHPDVVSKLVAKGADINIKNGNDDTPLSVATSPQGKFRKIPRLR